MDDEIYSDVYNNFKTKSSDELKGIIIYNNSDEWSTEAFEVAKAILQERGENVPEIINDNIQDPKIEIKNSRVYVDGIKTNVKEDDLEKFQLMGDYERLVLPIIEKHFSSTEIEAIPSMDKKKNLKDELEEDYDKFWDKVITHISKEKLTMLYNDLKAVSEMINDRMQNNRIKGLWALILGAGIFLFSGWLIFFGIKVDAVLTELIKVNLIIPNFWKIVIIVIFVGVGAYGVWLEYLDEKFKFTHDRSLIKSVNGDIAKIRDKILDY